MRTRGWVCIGSIIALFAIPLLFDPSDIAVDLGTGLLFTGVGLVGAAVGGERLRAAFRDDRS